MAEGKIGAIVVSAGQSRRMKGINKAFADLAGRPLIAWSLYALQKCGAIDEIVIVLHRGSLEQGQELLDQYQWSKVIALCQGGARRQDSVREGLERLTGFAWVIIHDGARPLVTSDLIERGLEEAKQTGAAAAAVPMKDTVKVSSPDNFVEYTPQRDTLWAVQTPQVFDFDLIYQSHQQVSEDVNEQVNQISSVAQEVSASNESLVKIVDSGGSTAEQNTSAAQQMTTNAKETSDSIESVSSRAEQSRAEHQPRSCPVPLKR